MIATTLKDLKRPPRGIVYVGGGLVSASTSMLSDDEGWIEQTPRVGGRKVGGAAGDNEVYVALSGEAAKALRRHRWRDVRLAYDGYIAWAIRNIEDGALIAAMPEGDGTWLTRITILGGVVEKIVERQLPAATHPGFKHDLEAVVQTSQATGSHMSLVLAIDMPEIEDGFLGLRNVRSEPLKKAPLGKVAIGTWALPLKLVQWPTLMTALAGLWLAYSVIDASTRIGLRQAQYREATQGIESAFKAGTAYVKFLEAQKSLLTQLSTDTNVASGLKPLLTSLATTPEAYLVSLAIGEVKGEQKFTLSFAMEKDAQHTAATQASPILQRLAKQTGVQVDLAAYKENTFKEIDRKKKFWVFEVTGKVPAAPPPEGEA